MITWIIVSSALSALVAGGGSYLISRRLSSANVEILLEQSKAKAKAIEYEAEKTLQESKIKAKEIELESKQKYERETAKIVKEYENNRLEFEKEKLRENQKLEHKQCSLDRERQLINRDKNVLLQEQESLKKLKTNYQEKLEDLTNKLATISTITKSEAKKILFKKIQEESRQEIAQILRKQEKELREEAKAKAAYILAQATSRFAGEFAAERLIHTIILPNDEMKARIIGKDGRNIKTLEMICGVDIIIDDTPGVIVVS